METLSIRVSGVILEEEESGERTEDQNAVWNIDYYDAYGGSFWGPADTTDNCQPR